MNLYDEANTLLESLDLVSQFERFGVVEIIGSYRYKTMVDRDIDLSVWPTREIDFAIRSDMMCELSRLQSCRSLRMSDLLHFPDHANRPLKGIWFGPKFIHPISGHSWNIDIWLIDRVHDPTQEDNSLHRRMLNITDQQRATIVQIKQDLIVRQEAKKGETSAKVYRAVLDHDVQSYSEYLRVEES